jgi:hypothetical protein
MKNKPEKLFTFLAIFIASLLMACSVYSHYNELIEIDSLSTHSSFENPDPEGLLADKQNKAKSLTQSSSLLFCFSSFFRMEPLPLFSSPIPSTVESISVLRC